MLSILVYTLQFTVQFDQFSLPNMVKIDVRPVSVCNAARLPTLQRSRLAFREPITYYEKDISKYLCLYIILLLG